MELPEFLQPEPMSDKQALVIFKEAVTQALIDEFGDSAKTISRISRGIENAEASWRPRARAMFGARVDQYFEKLDRT